MSKLSAHYRFDEGQRESIRRIISTAKSMLSRNAISRAGEGLPSSAAQFPARKDCGDDANGSFATFIHFFFHRGSPQEFAAKEGNYSLLLLLPLVPEQLDGSRPIPMCQLSSLMLGWISGQAPKII